MIITLIFLCAAAVLAIPSAVALFRVIRSGNKEFRDLQGELDNFYDEETIDNPYDRIENLEAENQVLREADHEPTPPNELSTLDWWVAAGAPITRAPNTPVSTLDSLVDMCGGERATILKLARGYDRVERAYVKQSEDYGHYLRALEVAKEGLSKALDTQNASTKRIKDLERFLQCANVKRKDFQHRWKKSVSKVRATECKLAAERAQLKYVGDIYDNLVQALIDKKPIVVNPIYGIAYAKDCPPPGLPKGL